MHDRSVARLLLGWRAVSTRRPTTFLLTLSLALLGLWGCEGATADPPPGDVTQPPDGFDDHTVGSFDTTEAFIEWADLGETPVQAKVVISGFPAGEGELRVLDPHFYALHDEWYYFRLLNGYDVPGALSAPLTGLSFASIAEIYDAYRSAATLPLDLRWFDTRLASSGFYDAALGRCDGQVGACPRHFGLGSLVYLPPEPKRVFPGEIWAFELEYIDLPDADLIARYLDRVAKVLPESARGQLRWLARSSTQQEALAQSLRSGGPLADRVLTYADLVTPGETVAYNPGVTAGNVLRVPKGTLSKALLKPTDIVVLEEVPDELPPVAGIITAVPQTPQAHFNLLAVARGTPNAYVGGAESDPVLAALAADRRPVALDVRDGAVRWRPLSSEEWATWRAKKTPPPPVLVPASLDGMPYTLELEPGSIADARAALPTVGGKCAGMLALVSDPENPTPFRPLSVTVRAYAEHLAPLQSTLTALLADKEFTADSRTRYLALEGFDAFAAAHASDPDALSWLKAFPVKTHSAVLVQVLAGGGVKGLIKGRPIAPGTLSTLQAAISARFAALSPEQGLRFRSSSTAEDVDGFNGAGVYTSDTGWLEPPPGKEKRTIEAALLEVWASFWGFPAFEERSSAGISHLAGRMGVLVHPRFQDDAEIANGVIILQLSRVGGQVRTIMTVNVQAGALSVTNPPPGSGIVPEVDHIDADGQLSRVQPSSETDAHILSDAELEWLLTRLEPLALGWLDAQNAEGTPGEASFSVTLDLEFRKVGHDWPLLRAGPPPDNGPRIVLKQVRPLSRAPRFDAAALDGAEVPLDIRAAAERVEQRTCTLGPAQLQALDVTTDAGAVLLPFHDTPFFARAVVTFPQGLPAAGLAAGARFVLGHDAAALVHPPGGWAAQVTPPEGLGWTKLSFDADGTWRLDLGGNFIQGEGAGCVRQSLGVTPEAWLLSLFDAQ